MRIAASAEVSALCCRAAHRSSTPKNAEKAAPPAIALRDALMRERHEPPPFPPAAAAPLPSAAAAAPATFPLTMTVPAVTVICPTACPAAAPAFPVADKPRTPAFAFCSSRTILYRPPANTPPASTEPMPSNARNFCFS